MGTRERGFEAQTQGRIGESEFQRLVDRAGLVATKASPDVTGWDFCVEEPELPAPTLPLTLDRRPNALRCFVQVKTIGHIESRVRIPLIHWERMVKQAVPWFVFVLRVVDRTPTSALLVHIGEHWIARTLKELAAFSSKSSDGLADRGIEVRWRPEDELTPLTPEGLAQRLRKYAGDDPRRYTEWKQRLVDGIGYEGAPFRLKVTLRPDRIEEAAEFAVGLRKDLAIKSADLEHVRFGVSVPLKTIAEGTIEFASPPVTGRTRLAAVRRRTGMRSLLEFDLVASPHVLPGLPPGMDRLVLRCPGVCIVACRSTLKVRYSPPEGETPVAIRTIGPAAEFVNTMADPGGFALEIWKHGTMEPLLCRDLPSVGSELREASAAPADAWMICHRLGIEDLLIAPDNIYAQDRSLFFLRVAFEAAGGASATLREFDVEPSITGSISSAISLCHVELGDTICAASISCTGRARSEWDGDTQPRVIIEDATFRAHGVTVLSRTAFQERAERLQQELIEAAVDEVQRSGAVHTFVPRSH